MSRKAVSPRRFFLFLAALFFALAFLQLSVRDGDNRLALLAVAVPAALVLGSLLPVRIFSLDRFLSGMALTLCAFSVLAVAVTDPGRAVAHAVRCVVAMAFLVPGVLVIRGVRASVNTAVASGLLSLGLLSVPLLMPYLDFPCNETAVILLIVACVSLLACRKQLAAMLLAVAGTGFMLAGGHPVTAVIWGILFLSLLWVFSARLSVMVLTLASVGLVFYGAWLLVPDLFALPDDPVPAFAFRPSLFGPESADLIPDARGAMLPLLACRYGLIFAVCVFMAYPLIMLRGISLARAARLRFYGLLAVGLSLMLSLFSLGALIYDMGILPLQGIPMPFLSDDLPSLCAWFFSVGMLGGISAMNRQDLEENERLAALSR